MSKDIISMKGLEVTAVYINKGPVKEVPCALTVKYSAAFKSYVTTLKWYGKVKVLAWASPLHTKGKRSGDPRRDTACDSRL